MHSMLSGEDHGKVFDRPLKGVRKIVLSGSVNSLKLLNLVSIRLRLKARSIFLSGFWSF